MHNYKFICLHCLRSQKGTGVCCGWSMFNIGSKARAPKKTANKSEWKQFINYFIFSSNNRGQLKRIIELRKEYGLSTTEQIDKLTKLKVEHEEKFSFLDIKHHEKLLEVEHYTWSYNENKIFVNQLNNIISRYTQYKVVKEFTHEKEYYIVPIHASLHGTYIFPSTIDKYDIYKVRAIVVDRHKHLFNFRIKTNNINEILEDSGFESGFRSQFASRQMYLTFATKENALAFQYEYLTHIIPFFMEKGVEFVGQLAKKAEIDFSRVIKKSPELLI